MNATSEMLIEIAAKIREGKREEFVPDEKLAQLLISVANEMEIVKTKLAALEF
jgi:hypothetical protein